MSIAVVDPREDAGAKVRAYEQANVGPWVAVCMSVSRRRWTGPCPDGVKSQVSIVQEYHTSPLIQPKPTSNTTTITDPSYIPRASCKSPIYLIKSLSYILCHRTLWVGGHWVLTQPEGCLESFVLAIEILQK